jgi:hypothetical protein
MIATANEHGSCDGKGAGGGGEALGGVAAGRRVAALHACASLPRATTGPGCRLPRGSPLSEPDRSARRGGALAVVLLLARPRGPDAAGAAPSADARGSGFWSREDAWCSFLLEGNASIPPVRRPWTTNRRMSSVCRFCWSRAARSDAFPSGGGWSCETRTARDPPRFRDRTVSPEGTQRGTRCGRCRDRVYREVAPGSTIFLVVASPGFGPVAALPVSARRRLPIALPVSVPGQAVARAAR